MDLNLTSALSAVADRVDASVWWVRRQDLPRAARSFWQRSSRGWSDTEVWNLGFSTCSRLADQLEFLADNAHSWPLGRYDSFEDWTSALRINAAKLRRANGSADYDTAADTWWTMTAEDDPRADQALEVTQRIEAADRQAASEGLAWVAANWQDLWD